MIFFSNLLIMLTKCSDYNIKYASVWWQLHTELAMVSAVSSLQQSLADRKNWENELIKISLKRLC